MTAQPGAQRALARLAADRSHRHLAHTAEKALA